MPALEHVLPKLYARVPLGMVLGLDRMVAACARAGNPERGFPAVHVAGTNGKGSVCALVEAMAREGGRRTGLYTSPHLCRFAERIRIGGEPVDDATLADLLERALAAGPDLSFFETATLAAFLAFRDAKVDLAVLEVGIGGSLDATNVIPPPVAAAVTRIALDHTEWLGDTLVAIAREKAGIAKPGVELVTGPMPAEVREAIDAVARERGARTFAIDDDAAAMAFARSTPLALAGDYQRVNAAIAGRLAGQIGVDEGARTRGMGTVRWPGRLERIADTDGRDLLLDAAHNPDGAASLGRYVQTLALAPSEVTLVFGTLADKAWREMIDGLAPLAATRIYVAPRGRAATDPKDIAARHAGATAETLEDALELAQLGRPKLTIVCGSVYLIGEARARLLGLPRDPPVAL